MRKVAAGSETTARCASGVAPPAANPTPAWARTEGSLDGVQQEPGLASLCMLGIEFGRHNLRLRLAGCYDQLLQLIAQHICLLAEFFAGGQVDKLVWVAALVVEKIFVIPGAGLIGLRICIRIRHAIHPIRGAD